ncbi:MAG: hydroxymethylpyrimidine/phosphomethylpyrimidine kinase [bacterium]|nr:hydroxymethylpyrimidine/phosphomethylpyrimidine kinase [bacterium]
MKRALSIAGFDPSGGAGVIADLKVFHQFGLQGYAATTALTSQNSNEFFELEWIDISKVNSQVRAVLANVDVCKIGIVPSLQYLNDLIEVIGQTNRNIPIIWDPVIQSSTGFRFLIDIETDVLKQVLSKLFIITPNLEELNSLETYLPSIFDYTHVIVKGGHSNTELATDQLFFKGEKKPIEISRKKLSGITKHGTGCAFSSAIAASLANGNELPTAFNQANEYVNKLLHTGQGKECAHHEIQWK